MKYLITATAVIMLIGCKNIQNTTIHDKLPGEEKRDSNLGRKIITEFEIVANLNEPYRLQSNSLIKEVKILCIHGILHLLGYDHSNKKSEKVMFDLQEKLYEKFR